MTSQAFTPEQIDTIRAIVREEMAAEKDRGPEMGRCAYCEGEFPESALDYRSMDPACASCQSTVAPDRPPRQYTQFAGHGLTR